MSGIDYEVRTRFHPEPPTAEEQEGMARVDPTMAGIFAHKLLTIASEGNELVIKLGASTGCRWGDTAVAIYTASGDNASCATGLFFHAVLGTLAVKYIMKHWLNNPAVGVKPGDAFFSNDPFYSGVHAPDMGIFAPVFHGEKLVCWVGAVPSRAAASPKPICSCIRSRSLSLIAGSNLPSAHSVRSQHSISNAEWSHTGT